MKKYELTQYEFVKVRVDHKPDKSLALRARDLIFFTTDLQTVNYYTAIHC